MSLGVNDEERNQILQAILETEEDEDTIYFYDKISGQKKKRRKNKYLDRDHFLSLFSQKYIYYSNEEERTNKDSRFGRISGYGL